MSTQTALVTGANGFIGTAVCAELRASAIEFRAAARRPQPGMAGVGDIGATTDWSGILPGCTSVLHLANRAHVTNEHDPNAVDVCRAINVAGSLNLIQQAMRFGIRRFVYVSSVGVYGRSHAGVCTPETTPTPHNAYAQSKLEAELALSQAAAAGSIELVIVRPPLVYGPGVKANFLALVRAVEQGVPLPFASVDNARSIVSVRNLASFLKACLTHPDAPGAPLLVSDGQDWSTPQLVRGIGKALGKPARMLPVPPALLEALAKLVRRPHMADSLVRSLAVDAASSQRRVAWQPRQLPEAEMDEMVRAIRSSEAGRT